MFVHNTVMLIQVNLDANLLLYIGDISIQKTAFKSIHFITQCNTFLTFYGSSVGLVQMSFWTNLEFFYGYFAFCKDGNILKVSL